MKLGKTARAAGAAANNVQLLYDCLGLPTSSNYPSVKDAVIISIDFENIAHMCKKKPVANLSTQMGVAILDTRDLLFSHPNIISTYNFAIGPPEYVESARRKFIFGETKEISSSDVARELESLFPRSRKIILVSHGIGNELLVLQRLQFDFKTSIFGMLDTYQLSLLLIPGARERTLAGLLDALQIPFHSLHSAGNDAHFTLRTLLLLATEGYRGSQYFQHGSGDRLEQLNRIGLSQIPTKKATKQDEASMRRLNELARIGVSVIPVKRSIKQRFKATKRYEHSRKYRARTWDIAAQGQIRTERAERRARREEISYWPRGCFWEGNREERKEREREKIEAREPNVDAFIQSLLLIEPFGEDLARQQRNEIETEKPNFDEAVQSLLLIVDPFGEDLP
jgi:hypothetical protein